MRGRILRHIMLAMAVAIGAGVTDGLAKRPPTGYTDPQTQLGVHVAALSGLSSQSWYNLDMTVTSADPRSAADEALSEVLPDAILSNQSYGLEFVKIQNSRGAIHIRFRQTLDDIRVYGSSVSVHFSNDGTTVNAIQSRLAAATEPLQGEWRLSRDQAIMQASNLIDSPSRISPTTPERVIFVTSSGIPRAAWQFVYPVQDPHADWELVIDAESGELLSRMNTMKYIDGSGMIFNPDPLTTAETWYGDDGFIDNDDADSQQLTAERQLDTLRDISFHDGAYHLEGPYVEIVDFEAPTVAPVTALTPDGFDFTRAQDGFEDVNAYYHIDRMQRHVQSLGFFDLQNAPIQVDAHGFNGQDNSYYSPTFNRLSFGTGGVDDAEDADVIYHEYGHALHDAAVDGYLTGYAAASIDEGISDYWSVSFSARESSFHDYWVFNWDAHNPFLEGRFVINDRTYPNDWSMGIYNSGNIWSHALWLIREQIGADDADALVLQSLYYHSSYMSVPDAAQALMQAEEDLFGGQYHTIVQNALNTKGFLTETGTLAGTVTDAVTGEPLPEAELMVNAQAHLWVWIQQNGEYQKSDIITGDWLVMAELDGYESWQQAVTINYNETTQLDVEMAPYGVTVDHDTLSLHAYIGSSATDQVGITGVVDAPLWVGRGEPVTPDPGDADSMAPSIGMALPYGYPQDIEFVNNCFYVTVTHDGTRLIHVLDSDGNFLREFPQPVFGGSELNGLTWDGEYLYGAASTEVVQFDTLGSLVTTIPVDDYSIRQLAYDETNDWFWATAGFSNVIAIDRSGSVITVHETDFDLAGIAVDQGIDNPYTLLLLEQRLDSPPLNNLYRMNPNTGETQSVNGWYFDGAGNVKGGALVSGFSPDEDYLYFTAIYQHVAFESILRYRIRWNSPWLSVHPPRGVIEAGEQLDISILADASALGVGTYNAHLRWLFTNGAAPVWIPVQLEVTAVAADDADDARLPDQFNVSRPSPNPFNASTSFSVTLPHEAEVMFTVYDLLGRQVDRMSWYQSAGSRQISWSPPSAAASGMYLLRISTPGAVPVLHKVVVVK